jgi:hypothetical protein
VHTRCTKNVHGVTLCHEKQKAFITMERAKKILKCALLAVVLLLRYIPHREQATTSGGIRESITHSFFSLAGEGTGSAIKFLGCRLSE